MTKNSKLITIYYPENEVAQNAVCAVLESAGIECYAKNAGVQNLFGAGQIGGGNVAVGGIEIQVAAEDVETATQLLNEEFPPENDSGSPADEQNPQTILNRRINKSIVFAILWLGGIGSFFALLYGLKSLKFINNSEEELAGKGKALFGVGLGIFGLILFIPFWYMVIVN